MTGTISENSVRRGSLSGRLALCGAILAALVLSGCDRCGDPIKFNTPSLPKSCYGVSQDK